MMQNLIILQSITETFDNDIKLSSNPQKTSRTYNKSPKKLYRACEAIQGGPAKVRTTYIFDGITFESMGKIH